MISVIIPISGHKHYQNLKTSLHFLKMQTFQDFEIVLVEQETEFYKKISFIDKYIHIVNHHNHWFHRNWCFNVGANISEGQSFLFMDADLVFERDYLLDIMELLMKYPWFVAWERMYYLDKHLSEIVQKNKTIVKPDRVFGIKEPTYPGIYGASGGSVCIKKDFFYDMFGGHNENYFGWGRDDNDGAFRANHILGKYPVMKGRDIFHLWHDRADYSTPIENNDHQLWMTEHNVKEMNKRLVDTKLGNPETPTMVYNWDLKM